MAKPIRVLLVEDQPILGAALRLLLDSQPLFALAGTATDSQSALTLCAREQPDIILLDLSSGDGHLLNGIPTLLKSAPQVRLIVLTGGTGPALHRRAIELGALGLVRKAESPEVLFKAIERVHAGEVWIERTLTATVLSEMAERTEQIRAEALRIHALTARENEILQLLLEGLKSKQIAARLVISEKTVQHHIAAIFQKLDVHDRLELAVFAQRNGLWQPPR